jgi:serine/alanine racemase
MYIIWSLFYLVIIQLPDWLKNGTNLRDILIYIEYATVRGDSYLHLWYLSSLYTGVFLLWLMLKWFKLKTTLKISLALFVLGLLLLPYYFLIKPIVESFSVLNGLYTLFNRFIGWPRCGLFFGFMYVTLGAYLSKCKIKTNSSFCAIGLVLSLVVSVFEIILINNHWSWDSGVYGALQISHIPIVTFLFCLLISFDKINLKHAKEIRTISTLVYLLHPLVFHLIGETNFYIQISKYPFCGGLTVFLLSILVACAWITIEKHTPFNFLRKLR